MARQPATGQMISMDPNRADPRLVWLASVLAAAVLVVFLTQS
ncbi:MAG TPA: hypothetical protein VIJ17_08720 [Pseudolabrys sp.]